MIVSSRSLAGCFAALLFALAAAARGDEAPLSPEELAQVKAAEASRIAAIDRVYGSVVAVYGNDRQGGGSGVIFHPAGYALTNHHVVDGAGAEGWGGLADGRQYHWKLIGTDPGGDVAVIRLEGKDEFPYSPLGDSDTVRVGDWAMAMGNPFILAEDQRPTATLGVVSGIERFQPEAGGNMLLYGNCIQVDSSINPGNSGGPLFNLRGEVIGINGRGSFQDRGRVNVGLGYAISVNQIKYFLPELMATKVAQHGVLDAVFADRTGGVLCESINLDAPAASAGLALGDRLLEFEGKPIRTANQFLNLISILPGDWPAHLVLERKGRRFDVYTRLLPLGYEAPPRPPELPMPMPLPMPGRRPAPEKIEPPAPEPIEPPAPEYPEAPDMPTPTPPPAKIPVTIDVQGKVKDETVNAAIAQELLAGARAAISRGGAASSSDLAWKLVDEVRSVGQAAPAAPWRLETILAADGRFRVERKRDGRVDAWGFDGESYWSHAADEPARTLTPLKAVREPMIRQAALVAALRDPAGFARLGKVVLDGADKANGRLAWRLKITDSHDDWFFVWFSQPEGDAAGREFSLSKAGPNLDGDGAFPYMVFSDWRPVEGLGELPFKRTAAANLAERAVYEMHLVEAAVIEPVGDSVFQSPSKEGP